jgi:uncharacterized membrane protein YphA (DoxX/SURF4 family)
VDAAFLIVRLILGLGPAAHGSQKLLGLSGGGGMAGSGGSFKGLGFRPAARAAEAIVAAGNLIVRRRAA